MIPITTLTGVSATGDIVSGPGYPTFLVMGMPASCIGDAVAGAACTGVVASTMTPLHIVGGRPSATLTCVVSGVNPATGIPVATVESVTVGVTYLA